MSSLAQIDELLNAALQWAVEEPGEMPARLIKAAEVLDDCSAVGVAMIDELLAIEIAAMQVVENVRDYLGCVGSRLTSETGRRLPTGEATPRFWAAICLLIKRVSVVDGLTPERQCMLSEFEARLEAQ